MRLFLIYPLFAVAFIAACVALVAVSVIVFCDVSIDALRRPTVRGNV